LRRYIKADTVPFTVSKRKAATITMVLRTSQVGRCRLTL
jgi:hypothetical protein